MRRAPARPVRACFVRSCCSILVEEDDLRAIRCNATPSEDFPHASHCALHALHFALHTCTFRTQRLILSQIMWALHTSSQLFSSHHISFPIYHLSKFSQLFSSYPSIISTQKLETQMHLHFTQEKRLKNIFILQYLSPQFFYIPICS